MVTGLKRNSNGDHRWRSGLFFLLPIVFFWGGVPGIDPQSYDGCNMRFCVCTFSLCQTVFKAFCVFQLLFVMVLLFFQETFLLRLGVTLLVRKS